MVGTDSGFYILNSASNDPSITEDDRQRLCYGFGNFDSIADDDLLPFFYLQQIFGKLHKALLIAQKLIRVVLRLDQKIMITYLWGVVFCSVVIRSLLMLKLHWQSECWAFRNG